MIWHEWESVNLETVHNSQLLSWSLRSEKKKVFGLFVILDYQFDRLDGFGVFWISVL